MEKQDLRAKTIQELRKMAKTKGLVARTNWKKEDFIKALSSKKVSGSRAVKPVKRYPAKKTADRKRAVSKTAKKPVRRKQGQSASPKHPATVRKRTIAELRVQAKGPAVKAGRPVPPPVKPPAELVLPPLPAEYHDDKIVSMPVTPRRLYVYWEIPENKIVKYKGSLNIKAVDINTNSFFYTPVSGRIGESFIAINPDSDYSIEIGIIDSKGEFVHISQVESTSGAPEVHTGPTADRHNEDIQSGKQPETTGQAPEGALPEEFLAIPDSVGSSY